ncbi:catalase family protein [Methylophilus sp.]|uniref:catalase family protein n=1 Tax=Methylophilus sp. TaxID=29541 RepID=UPI0040373282
MSTPPSISTAPTISTALASPVTYDPAYEIPEQDEQQTIQALVSTLQSISDVTARDSGHGYRSVHVKSHGVLRGNLTVAPGLPPELKQGIFGYEQVYETVIRLSTSPGDFLADSVSTPRGFAVKVIGVQGERLQGDAADNTQDFLLVTGPAFLNKDAKGFLSGLKLLAKTTNRFPEFKKVISAVLRGLARLVESLGGESATLKAMGGYPETHILGEQFFTQVPVLYGPYMAKLSVRPASSGLRALIGKHLNSRDDPHALRQAVNAFFATHAGQWEVLVQLCRNLDTMPIEDAAAVWPEHESPYLKVATIDVKPQKAWDDKLTPPIEDKLAFSPWNGIAAHRPLGSVMRARKLTYQHSSSFRRQMNGCPMHEPQSTQQL